MTTPDDKIADDIISTLEKLRAENPGDFMAVAEIRNEVLEEAAQVAENMGGDFIECDRAGDGYREARTAIAKALRSLKSGGKNA